MDNSPNNPNPKNKSAAITLIWLMVGLAPVPILVLVTSVIGVSQGLDGIFLLFLCVTCNLLGGFGCARNLKNQAARIALGLFLAGCFFVATVIIPILVGFSHIQM
jgi:FtsH-binding integral membrane protein